MQGVCHKPIPLTSTNPNSNNPTKAGLVAGSEMAVTQVQLTQQLFHINCWCANAVDSACHRPTPILLPLQSLAMAGVSVATVGSGYPDTITLLTLLNLLTLPTLLILLTLGYMY
jgi:hypothetical protein